jgi:hypothetical protein
LQLLAPSTLFTPIRMASSHTSSFLEYGRVS